MSGLLSLSKDRCTIKHPFTSTDLKNLARFMFGASRQTGNELGRFVSCMGPVTIKHDGQDGAVWQVGTKQFASATDFREIMSVLPISDKKFIGDMYLSANVLGQRQYLVLPFQSKDLLWFRNEKELVEYYHEQNVIPAVDKFIRRPWVWQSVSV